MIKNFFLSERFIKVFDKVVHISIFVSFFVFALETVKELNPYQLYFEIIETISLLIFAIEYIYRIYDAHNKKKTLKYMLSFIGIIDLLTILPIFIPAIKGFDLRFIKVFRLFSLFRIFKLYRYSEHLQAIIKVVSSKKGDLLATLFSTLIVMVFFSCLAYYFEKERQPEAFSNLFQAMYWGVSTVATVGYGDIYPMTIGGKITAALLAMLGVAVLTIPAAILSAGFIEEIQSRKQRTVKFEAPIYTPGSNNHGPNQDARRHDTSSTKIEAVEEEEEAIK